MAETVILDQIISGTLQIIRDGSGNAKVLASYVVADSRRTVQRQRNEYLSLTPAEQAMVNGFWDAGAIKVRTLEGL